MTIDADAPDRTVVLDIEASAYALPGSYPLEVAVAYVASGESKSWLIRPTESWLSRGYWDPASEAVHGISRELLLADGRPVEQVQAELTEAVQGYRVLSDATSADGYWLDVLYELAEPPFALERIADYIRPATGLTGIAARERFVVAEAEARRRVPRRHRAEPDAKRWAEVLRILMRLA